MCYPIEKWWKAVYTFGFIDDGTFTLKVRVTAMASQLTCYIIPALQINCTCTSSSDTHLVADKTKNTRRKTITIFATSKLSVHGLVHSGDKETPTAGFLAMPNVYLGQEYMLDSYTPRSNSAKLTISAIEDYTWISISGADFCHTANDSQVTENISLVATESVFLKTCQDDSNITGTQVVSNKPVSVVVGSSKVFIPRTFSGDPSFIIEQLLPVSAWGRMHIIPPFHQATNGWEVRILVVHKPTPVFFYECGVHTPDNPFSMNISTFYTFGSNSSQSLCVVVSDYPIQVIQYMKSSQNIQRGDGSMVLIPPVNDFHGNITFSATINDTHVDIISAKKGMENIRLNDMHLTAGWTCTNCENTLMDQCSDDDNYCYSHTSISEGVHTVTGAADSGPFLVRLYEHENKYGAAMLADIIIPSGMC